MFAKNSVIAAFTLALGLLATIPALAAPHCLNVASRVELAASADPNCASPVGLCAGGVLHGSLRGNSEFIGTSFVTTVDTGDTGVLILTGDNTIHTPSGDLYTKDSIVLATDGVGEFAEVDTVVGGTGDFANATGKFTATGTFANGVGEGILHGEICWP